MENQIDIFHVIEEVEKESGTFYKTINQTRQEEKKEKENSNKQEKAVVRIMQRHPGQYLQSHVVHEMTVADKSLPNWTIDGIKRAITVLQQRGILMKSLTSEYEGRYDKRVHGWTLNPNRGSL